MSLDQIGLEYGTDKASSDHDYLRVYEEYIARLPTRQGSLLELGWLDGASMKMWRDWLPQGWTVTGLDIDPKDPLPGVNFIRGSQDDPLVVERAATEHGPFDVIVDDASHESHRTFASFTLLWSHLKPGGLYFIEDLLTSYHPHWNRIGEPIMEFLKRLADSVHRTDQDVRHVAFWPGLCLVQKES